MYSVAAKKFLQGLELAITLLKSNLEKEFNKNVKLVQNDFSKMLKIACETSRPERGLAKIELQKEVLVKLSCFDGILGEFRSEAIVIEDIDDLDPMDNQDEFDNIFSADYEDFHYSGSEEPDMDADEAVDNDGADES
jgi:hypothetical protein